MDTDRTTYAPLALIEYGDSGSYGLLLTDNAMVALSDEFEARGRWSNGYGWEFVARSAVDAYAPEIAERLSYDCEAGMFVARSGDLEALRLLAVLVSTTFHDRVRLGELLGSRSPAETKEVGSA
ncbi:Imm51 family immunity protein [Kitasatospora mediocidica]|uniref:Imm51 family immunity protein n=1 Tax=Kitasatospora mediocidica TaxID=58352 RepID=UPI00056243B8|nr:Imm51 family immunity protein [Kitasatospora mediocidica]